MDFLAWNCFGIGNYKTSRHLKELKRQRRIKVAFLSETKLKKGGIDKLKGDAGFDNGLEAPARGKKGGLALLWDNDVDLKLCSFSDNYFDMVITTNGEKWRLTGIYCFPEANRKRATFRLLDHLRSHIHNYPNLGDESVPDLPWCVLGDFNCLVTNGEKQGGRLYPRDSLEAFSDFLLDSGMYDMGYEGSFFTWSRGDILERLDRGIASQAWFDMFPRYEVRVLAPVASDHNPLHLRLDIHGQRRRSPRKFRFENMWTLETGCREVVEKAWRQEVEFQLWERVMVKIKKCADDLTQ